MDNQTGYGQVSPPGWAPHPPPVAVRPPLAQARVAVAVMVALAATGALTGLIWSVSSPRVQVIITTAGPDLAHYGSDEFFAGDGTFVIIGVLAGIVAALAVWLLARRWRGPVQLVALALGCLAGGLVAWQVGRHLGLAHFHNLLRTAGVGQRFGKPVDLRAKVALMTQPGVAVITYLVLVSWVARPDLGVPGAPGEGSVEPHRHP